ncbi:hypothetical protein [Infirmifilum sp. SLHALR2]|nr:MAG: hypothetical protein B7L53_09595 [Thermofilum sp. NZ13]
MRLAAEEGYASLRLAAGEEGALGALLAALELLSLFASVEDRELEAIRLIVPREAAELLRRRRLLKAARRREAAAELLKRARGSGRALQLELKLRGPVELPRGLARALEPAVRGALKLGSWSRIHEAGGHGEELYAYTREWAGVEGGRVAYRLLFEYRGPSGGLEEALRGLRVIDVDGGWLVEAKLEVELRLVIR